MSSDVLSPDHQAEQVETKHRKRAMLERRPGDSYTLRDLARHWHVGVGKIRRWLALGDLTAVNVSDSPRKPMWRITAGSVEEFERRRSSLPVRRLSRRRKRKGEVDYFPDD